MNKKCSNPQPPNLGGLKIGFLQQHNTPDVVNNIERLCDGIRDLAKRGAELVVLQELHNSLYFCQVEDVNLFDLAEPIPGPSTEIYSRIAKECGIVLVTSLFERRAPGLYHNTAVVFEKDGTMFVLSFCILMALNVVFSNVWGIILKEWKGCSKNTISVLIIGIIVLIISTFLPQLIG